MREKEGNARDGVPEKGTGSGKMRDDCAELYRILHKIWYSSTGDAQI